MRLPRAAIVACVLASVPLVQARQVGGVAGSRIGALASIAALTQDADAIVVATSDAPVRGRPLTLAVSRVLDGRGIGPAVSASPTEELMPDARALPLHGLWFLKRDGPRWTILAPAGGYVRPTDLLIALPPGDLPEAYRYAPDDSRADKVVQELRRAVEARSDGLVDSNLYQWLGNLAHPLPRSPLACERAVPGSPQLAECPTARLAREWGAATAARVASLVRSGYEPSIGLRSELGLVTDGGAVPALAQILDVTGVGEGSVQQAVAGALRNIHDEASVPQLARLLESPDRTIQYMGVTGLGLFVNDAPSGSMHSTRQGPREIVPSFPLFEADPELYVNNWKSWWAVYKSHQAAGPARP